MFQSQKENSLFVLSHCFAFGSNTVIRCDLNVTALIKIECKMSENDQMPYAETSLIEKQHERIFGP